MKKRILILFSILLISCSKDSSSNESQIDQQKDEGVVDNEENEKEAEDDETFSFPFSLSVILKNYTNSAEREGEFISVDFWKNEISPSPQVNITSLAGLDLDADFFKNGQEEVLIFFQEIYTGELEFIKYNLNNGEVFSILRTEMLLTEGNCFSPGSHFAANSNNYLFYNLDFCEPKEGIIPIVRNQITNQNVILPKIEEASMGDSFYRLWATEKHFFFHFTPLSGDGFDSSLIVYNSNTNEIVYEDRTKGQKIPVVDKQKIIIQRKSDGFLDLVDLEKGQTLYSNSISNSDILIFPESIGKAYMHGNKVGLMMFNRDDLLSFPAIYDFQTNNSVILDSELYREFFRSTGLNIPRPIRIPQEHIIDLESETFAVLYHGFTGDFIQKGNPDFIGLIYMNFDGEILYEYEFEQKPWIQQVVIKR